MAKLLSVFNRYIFMGGEEKAVDRIYRHLGEDHEMAACNFDSSDWKIPRAPGILTQLRHTFYNPHSRSAFEKAVREFKPDAAIFHNVFPVGSPSLYHAATELGVPVIQFAHNFRPFSVSGTLYVNGTFTEESLKGDYRREVLGGGWQGSILKSAVLALVLKRLHRSGWLNSVKAWVGVSRFMRDTFVNGAGLPPERVHALISSWDPIEKPEPVRDEGYYLFLSRLVALKGVETLLQAWELIERRLGAKAPALYIGGEGVLEARVREAATKSSKIRFLGLVHGEQKHDAISGCRAMLAPSLWWEPLGLVTYEAYDYSKPMLAARSGGLVETVQHGETGFLHEPGSAQGLADSVLGLEAMTREERAAMGRKGRHWLLANTRVEDWKQSFNRILGTL